MTTETKTITLETLYAEILEIKTLLRSAPPALAAAAGKKVGKISKKAAAATPKSAARKSTKSKQPKTMKAKGKAASRSGRLLFGGDD